MTTPRIPTEINEKQHVWAGARLAPDDLARLEALAGACGLSRSDAIRALIRAARPQAAVVKMVLPGFERRDGEAA